MALVINTNMPSLSAQRHSNRAKTGVQQAVERLSSGLRINRAKDDAAGLAISERMTAQIRGLEQGTRNAADGISLVQTTDGGMDELTQMAQRIRELAVQAANGTYSQDNRLAIQQEVDNLTAEMARLVHATDFNGVKVLNNTDPLTLQVGDDAGETIDVPPINLMGTPSLVPYDTDGWAAFYSARGMDVTIGTTAGEDVDWTTVPFNPNVNPNIANALVSEITMFMPGAVTLTMGPAAGSASLTINDPAALTNDFIRPKVETLQEFVSYYNANGGYPDSFGPDMRNHMSAWIDTTFRPDGDPDTSGIADTTATVVSWTAGRLEDWGSMSFEDDVFWLMEGDLEATIGSTYNIYEPWTTYDAVEIVYDENSAQLNILKPEYITTAAAQTAVATVQHVIDYYNANGGFPNAYGPAMLASVEAFAAQYEPYTGPAVPGTQVLNAVTDREPNTGVIDVTTQAAAQQSIALMGEDIDAISSERATMGAVHNRLESTIRNNQNVTENQSAARSRIRDADYAKETAELTRSQIIQQAGTAMLAQANTLPQNVLKLLS